MPPTRRDLIRMRYRRARTTASEIRWFAVFAVLIGLVDVVLGLIRPDTSTQIIQALAGLGLILGVLALREE